VRGAVVAAALLVLAACASTALGATADTRAAARGAAWLEARSSSSMPAGQQADLIVALRAAGVPRSRLRGRVRTLARAAPSYARTAGAAAKIARAATAVGANPARFGRVSYIGRIRRAYRAGRFGATAFDHALAVIALSGARRRVPPAAIATLRRSRGRGGWNLALSRHGRDEVDATALVIQAMRSTGVPRSDPALRAATRWLLRQRNRHGGFDARGGRRPTEANSTAAAILALRAMGRPAAGPKAELRNLQLTNGAFRWRARIAGSTLLATLDAVPALSR
jgi:uncharacterized SAM-binding protein YcdF (DUF218 family)